VYNAPTHGTCTQATLASIPDDSEGGQLRPVASLVAPDKIHSSE